MLAPATVIGLFETRRNVPGRPPRHRDKELTVVAAGEEEEHFFNSLRTRKKLLEGYERSNGTGCSYRLAQVGEKVKVLERKTWPRSRCLKFVCVVLPGSLRRSQGASSL